MKNTFLKSIIAAVVVSFVAACGGSNNNNNGSVINPNPGGTLPPGAQVKYTGSLYSINQSVAGDMVKVLNGSLYSAGQVVDSGIVEVSVQGSPYGGNNYFVNLTLYPRSKNPWWGFCLTVGSNCNQPLLISGNAAYYSDSTGGNMLQLQYGGWKIQIIASTGATDNVWNGNATTITNVKLKFIRPNQDPIVGGEDFAQSDIYRSNYYGYPYGAFTTTTQNPGWRPY